MKPIVKLSTIVDALYFQIDESTSYLDKNTGDVIVITEEEFRATDDGRPLDDYPEWQRPSIEIAKRIIDNDISDLIELPSNFDIDEYRMMEKFCYTIKNERKFEKLYNSIKGSGAFRMFKNYIHELRLEKKWDKYRDEAYKQIAIEWCEENRINYVDDLDERSIPET
jgi:hypothetical protein